MAWWVIALVVWFAASFAAAGVVALLARRGRSSAPASPDAPAERHLLRLRGAGRGRSAAAAAATHGLAGRPGPVGAPARRHRRR